MREAFENQYPSIALADYPDLELLYSPILQQYGSE